MSSKRRKGDECTYCGRSGPLSDDHIPPKSLFAKPRPELITVRACKRCNNEASMDDEYFRLVCSARHDTNEHPDAEAVWPAALRGLTKPQKVGFKRAFLDACREVPVHTGGGIYLGHATGFEADLSRLNRVACRIVKGLFYRHTGFRLPDDHEALAWATDGIERTPGEESTRTLIGKLLGAEPITIGHNTFTYRYQMLKDRPNASAWLLTVYEAVHFVGLTMPSDETPRARRNRFQSRLL